MITYLVSQKKIIYTGPIDEYIDYRLGTLEYRSVQFETEILNLPNYQGNAAVNFTDRETPYTRIIEHKWLEFGYDKNGNEISKTIISKEYSSEWKKGDEPYYPVNDEKIACYICNIKSYQKMNQMLSANSKFDSTIFH